MKIGRFSLTGGLTGLLLLAGLTTALATPAVAQLRFATGTLSGRFGAFENFTPSATAIQTPAPPPFDRLCGPNDPCPGNTFPGIAPGANSGLVPIRPEGAVISGATGLGDDVQIIANEWTLTTMNAFAPPFVPPGIGGIGTGFDGRVDSGTFMAGGGPGNLVFRPLAAGAGTQMVTTNRYPNAVGQPFGSTTVGPASVVSLTFPAIGATNQDPAINDTVEMRVIAGARQFGGAIEVIQDAPGQVIRDVGLGQVWSQTNARCDPAEPFGACPSGLRIGTPAPQEAEVRLYVGTVATAGGENPEETGFFQWNHTGWTTGTVSVINRIGIPWTSFAAEGTDVAGPSRNLVMVTPSISYGQEWSGAGDILDGTGLISTWDITFAPEPVSGAGLMAGLGLLGFLWRKQSS